MSATKSAATTSTSKASRFSSLRSHAKDAAAAALTIVEVWNSKPSTGNDLVDFLFN